MVRYFFCLVGIGFIFIPQLGNVGLAEETPAEIKSEDAMKVLQVEIRGIQEKLGHKQKERSQDPEVKELQAAIEKKSQEIGATREALRAKIGEKDPEMKTLMEQKNMMAQKLAGNQEQIKKLQEEMKNFQKEMGELAKKIGGRESAHAKDPDLKEAQDAIAAQEQELSLAKKAPLAKISEKEPEVKAMIEKMEGLQKQMQEIRASRKGARPEKKR